MKARAQRDSRAYDRFSQLVDGPMLVLAILWLPVLVVPLVTKLSASLASAFDAIDYLVWALFAVEYFVKLYLAPNRFRFVKTHIIDLIVIAVPFMRPLRILRFARFLRLVRAAVIVAEVLRRGRSILTHHGFHYVLLAVVLIVFAGAGLELSFEATAPGSNIHSYGDSLWWAVTTMTTVGYGDRFPVTAGGRGVAVTLMLVGIGLVGVVTATVASYFIEQEEDHVDEVQRQIEGRLARIEAVLELLATRTQPGAQFEVSISSNGNVPEGNGSEGNGDNALHSVLSESAGRATPD